MTSCLRPQVHVCPEGNWCQSPPCQQAWGLQVGGAPRGCWGPCLWGPTGEQGGTPWVRGGPVGRWGVPRVGPAMNGVTPWVLGALRVDRDTPWACGRGQARAAALGQGSGPGGKGRPGTHLARRRPAGGPPAAAAAGRAAAQGAAPSRRARTWGCRCGHWRGSGGGRGSPPPACARSGRRKRRGARGHQRQTKGSH